MKTRKIMPWNVRPGMQILLYAFPGLPPYAFNVVRVVKTRGTFTGASAWRVYYTDPMSALGERSELFHGRMKCRSGNSLPAEKALVIA